MTIATQTRQLLSKQKDAQVLWGMQCYVLASLIKNLLVKTVFASYCLKLTLPVFLKCFLMFAYFQPRVSYRHVSYKKRLFKTQTA